MKGSAFRRLAVSAIILFVGSNVSSLAHSPRDPSIVGNVARLTEKSIFVFRGRAIDVKYRNLTTATGTMPHTFVTYRVDDVISGAPPPLVTLRFIGGPDGTGGFLEVTGVPLFQAGDEDILFVSNNGMDTEADNSCALVECELGRYRVVNGSVYEGHGSPVVSIEGNRILTDGIGPPDVMDFTIPAPKFDDMLRKPEFTAQIKKLGITVAQARAWYEAEAPKTITIRPEMSVPVGKTPERQLSTSQQKDDLRPDVGLGVGSVIDGIRGAVKSARMAKSTSARRTFRNAYITTAVSLSVQAAEPPSNSRGEEILPRIDK